MTHNSASVWTWSVNNHIRWHFLIILAVDDAMCCTEVVFSPVFEAWLICWRTWKILWLSWRLMLPVLLAPCGTCICSHSALLQRAHSSARYCPNRSSNSIDCPRSNHWTERGRRAHWSSFFFTSSIASSRPRCPESELKEKPEECGHTICQEYCMWCVRNIGICHLHLLYSRWGHDWRVISSMKADISQLADMMFIYTSEKFWSCTYNQGIPHLWERCTGWLVSTTVNIFWNARNKITATCCLLTNAISELLSDLRCLFGTSQKEEPYHFT